MGCGAGALSVVDFSVETGGLAADIIRKQFYGKDAKDLTEAEK